MRLPLWIFIALVVETFGNDSLETALNAVTNRQGNYQDEYTDDPYDGNLYYRPRNNDLESEAQDSIRNLNVESSLMDYLREADNDDRDAGYQKSSPFRERLKQDTARPYNRKSKLDDDNANEQFYDSYQNSYYPNEYSKEPQNLYNMKKRSYYPSIRWESVGMKKRSRAFQPDGPRESLYLLNYAPRDEIFNRLREDENSNDDFDYQWPAYNQKKLDTPRIHKRFPVSKRSSGDSGSTSQKSANQMRMRNTRQYKRSSSREAATKTDAQVAKDLAEIFDPKPSSKNSKPKSSTDKSKLIKVTDLKTKSTKVVKVKNNMNQEALPTAMALNKSAQINNSKKSIDWSDYFGLDRRKKSEESLDSDWLMNRYNNAIAQRKQTDSINVGELDNDKELSEMDNKLRNVEESLIDETLKFIGAHEGGAATSKETRYVKNKIISRLAAAYSLEKMRRALTEYRRSFEVDKTLHNFENQSPHENVKRMSIGRKAAIDPNNDHRDKDDLEDNKIKCHESNCADSISGPYTHALDTCPQVVAICDEISNAFGQHRKSVKAVCEMHQMCVLCSDNNWFGPLRRCDVLYLSKINEICGDDSNCRANIGNVLSHKLNVDQTADCALACPENN